MGTERRLRKENLESRICLAATAVVEDGDLVISGDAEGDIEIVAVGEGAYEVSEGGVIIADSTELTGVTDDIRIELEESTTGTDDTVTVNLELAEDTVDKIYADQGDGNNTFSIIGGSIEKILYRGGDGSDNVELDTTVNSFAWLRLGDGDNTATIEGEVDRLFIRGGDDADVITMSESATAERATIRLGDGDNEVNIVGTVEEGLKVTGGEDSDQVSIAETAVVTGSVVLGLGNGENTATVDGTIDNSLIYAGGEGDDTLTLSETADVGDDIYVKLGEGENTVSSDATVGGDVDVVSENEEDESRLTVDDTNVSGEVNLGAGEQTSGYFRFSSGRGRTFQRFGLGRS